MSEVISVECASPHAYNPHLKKVLKSYQTSAMTSLSGPNSCMPPANWGKLCNTDVAIMLEPDMKKGLISSSSNSHHHHHHHHHHPPSQPPPQQQQHPSMMTNSPSSQQQQQQQPQQHQVNIAAANNNSAATASPVSAKKSASADTGGMIAASAAATPTKLCRSTPSASANANNSPAAAAAEYDPFLAPPPFPIQQIPILTTPDQGRSERSETQLEGETISCFIVGGEKRLCLPQILNSVLRDFSLQQINLVCDELQIFCSRCNPEQLEVLKATGVLPFSAPSCGLITKTDAERLCNALLYSSPPVRAPPRHCLKSSSVSESSPNKTGDPDTGGCDKQRAPDNNNSTPVQFKVYHECFGKCKGIYVSDLYSSPNALCIECTECHGLFPPQKFVCHAHKALENRTCHWGFDSANWRSYILLANDQANTDKLQSLLDDMKARYDYSNNKRKQYEHEEKDLSKKVKYAEDLSFGALPYNLYDPMLAAAYWYPPTSALSRVSAFRPWSPMVGKDGKPCLSSQHSSFLRESVPQSLPSFLSHGPPVLLNPERVVPISETERFERHYQPNVALAPASAQLQAGQKTAVVPSASRYSSPAPTAKSASHLDDADSHKALLSNPEMEVSTDTDETLSDSTIGAESTDYVPDKIMAGLTTRADLDSAPDTPINPEAELEPIQKLLDERGLGPEILEQVMNEVEKLRHKYKEELAVALQAKKSLQQELELHKISAKERLREASETKRSLRKELKQAQLEHEQQLKDALETQQQLRRELEATRIRRGDKIHEVAARANLAAENEQLRVRLEALEVEISQTRKSSIKGQELGAVKPRTSCNESPSPPVIKQEVLDDESPQSEKSAGE